MRCRAKLLLSVSMLLAVLLIPAAKGPAALPEEWVEFGGGTVDWGVSERWRCYVTGLIADGGIEVSEGAEQIPGTAAQGRLCTGTDQGSEAIRFPVLEGSWDPEFDELDVYLGGKVRFHGHAPPLGGQPGLDLTLSDLTVVVSEGTGTLFADVAGNTMRDPQPVFQDDLAIADVAMGAGPAEIAGGLSFAGLATTLTAEGAEVFDGYEPGEPFDPISASLAYAEEEPLAERPVIERARKGAVQAKKSVQVARVRCPGEVDCAVRVPQRVPLRVDGRRFQARVIATPRIAAGATGLVKARLDRRALGAFGEDRRAVLKVPLAASSGEERISRRVSVPLKR